MSIVEDRKAVLVALAAGFETRNLQPLSELLGTRPTAVAMVMARIALAEILTCATLLEQPLPPQLVGLVEQAIDAIPGSPLEGDAAAASDLASRHLLERLEHDRLAARIPEPRRQAQPAPSDWTELSSRVAALGALAVPELSTEPSTMLASRRVNLEQAAVLAAMQGHTLSCARTMRWLVFPDSVEESGDLVRELANYLQCWADEDPRLAYELGVIQAGLS